eukprot:6249857-Pyramimonas_sp.AAC.1
MLHTRVDVIQAYARPRRYRSAGGYRHRPWPRTALYSVLHWTGMDWNGLDWTGLDCTRTSSGSIATPVVPLRHPMAELDAVRLY